MFDINQLPMKTKTLFGICLFIALSQKGIAQDLKDGQVNRCIAPIFVKRQLWLFNSGGKIAASQDSVISKEYFDNQRINIQTDVPFEKDARFYCAFEKEGVQTHAHYFQGSTLPDEVIKKIKAWGRGGIIIFGVEEISEGKRKISFMKFVVE